MPYTLITANRNYSSWSLRPWLLMRVLAIPFEDRIEPFTKPSSYDEFRAFSPAGQVPVLIHPDGTVITESPAILTHIADSFPAARLIPAPGSSARAFHDAAYVSPPPR